MKRIAVEKVPAIWRLIKPWAVIEGTRVCAFCPSQRDAEEIAEALRWYRLLDARDEVAA